MKDQKIAELQDSLKRCLQEAEDWIDECRGCKPEEIIGYDGWAHNARRLLDDTIYTSMG